MIERVGRPVSSSEDLLVKILIKVRSKIDFSLLTVVTIIVYRAQMKTPTQSELSFLARKTTTSCISTHAMCLTTTRCESCKAWLRSMLTTWPCWSSSSTAQLTSQTNTNVKCSWIQTTAETFSSIINCLIRDCRSLAAISNLALKKQS